MMNSSKYTYETWYEKGMPHLQGYVDGDGNKTGEWKEWYPDGYMKAKYTYSDAVMNLRPPPIDNIDWNIVEDYTEWNPSYLKSAYTINSTREPGCISSRMRLYETDDKKFFIMERWWPNKQRKFVGMYDIDVTGWKKEGTWMKWFSNGMTNEKVVYGKVDIPLSESTRNTRIH